MGLILRPPGSLASLPDRLGHLGRFRRRVAVAAELFRVVAVPLAIATAACGLDVAVHLPAVVRVGFLGAVLISAGVLFLTGLRRANRLPTSPLAVALLLEDRFPRLNDAVASAVSFLTPGSTVERPGAGRFRAVAVTRAENVAGRHDLDQIAATGRAWRWFWAAAVVSAVAFAGFAAGPTRAAIAVVRLADPYGRHPFPTRTTLSLLEPAESPTLLARGNSFVARFVVGGEIPDQAVVAVRSGELPAVEELIPLPPESRAEFPDEHQAVFRLDPSRANVSFAFRITAGDADTGWREVTVAPPPVLVPRDGRPSPQVRLDYPAYTDLPPVELPDGTGVVEAVAGTRYTFRAAADRRIASAVLTVEGDLTAHRAAAATAAVVDDNPLSAVAASLLTAEYARPIPVRVSGPDGTLLDAEFTPPMAGLYALRFTDEAGLTGVRLLNFDVFPDPSPVVALTRPDPTADPTIVLPTGSVTVNCRAEDRTFGVRNMALEYRVGGPGEPFRRRLLSDLAAAGQCLPAIAGPAPPGKPKPVGVDAGVTVPVAALVSADGTPPADGDTVTLRATATDWDDVAWTKPPGRSAEVELRIMAGSSVEAMLQKELAGMRPELLRLREDQRAARRAVEEVAGAAEAGELQPEHPGRLAQAEQTQRQVRNAVADPEAGIRAKADRLRQTVRANGLPRSPTTDRLDAVADDLGRLADQPLDAADPPLAAARQLAADPDGPPDPEKLAGLLGRAGAHQRAAEAGFEGVLERLEQWAGAGEVRGEARAMKDQLQAAGAAADRARPPTGAAPTPAEKAALNGAADQFDRLADRAGGVVGKAARLAAEKAHRAEDLRAAAADKDRQAVALTAEAESKPPQSEAASELTAQAADLSAEADDLRRAADRAAAEAGALQQSLDAAGGQALPRDLRDAADALRKNQPDRAATARRAAADRLDRLTDGLTERSEPSPAGDLQENRAEAADELQKLGDAQDELRKKARDAAALPDPAERAEALKKLAAEQDRLRRRAEIVAQKLSRDRSDRAADAARKAGEAMDAARDRLAQGEPPTDPQGDALDQLDQALDTLEREQQQAAEQLSREQQVELAGLVRNFHDRQRAAVAEADRLQATATELKNWDRPLIASLADLEDRERALADELRGFVEAKFADVPVFHRLADRAAAGMDRAADLAGERRDDILTADPDDPFDPDLEAASAARVRRPMDTALRRLGQILSAVDPTSDGVGDAEPPKPPDPAEPPPAEADPEAAPGDGDPGQSPDMAQVLAQLKALRAVQAEVNERTAAFAETHPGDKELTDDDLVRTQSDRTDPAGRGRIVRPARRGVPPPDGGAMTRTLLGLCVITGTVATASAVGVFPPIPYVPADAVERAATPPAEPMADPNDPSAIADRITENTKLAGDRLASADPGDQTRKTQVNVLNDIDKLLKMAENPPPQGGGGTPPPQAGGDPSGGPPPMGGNDSPPDGAPPMGSGGGPMGGMPPHMGDSGDGQADKPGGSESPGAGGKPKPGSGGWRDRAGRERGNGTPKPTPAGPDKLAAKPMPGDGPKAEAGEPGGGPSGNGSAAGKATPSLPLDDPYTKEVWGHLPEQMRRQMTQYYREQFVSKYGDLLRQYYSSLAEKDTTGRDR